MSLSEIAREMVAALEQGQYTTAAGNVIDIKPLVASCVDRTQCYLPEGLAALREQIVSQPAKYMNTSFEVVNETTLEGCSHVVAGNQFKRVGVLNFASAKHPGGGFLGGARAQEESLARSTGLYSSLLKYPAHYTFHKQHKTTLYSDRMIYSPDCPVLRTDDGTWLEQPYIVDFITSPAPNAGAIKQNEPQSIAQIEPVFRERISKLLALLASQECDALILGAWGCGAFRNDPQLVASLFWEQLKPDGQFWGRFRYIRFSVFDKWEGLKNFTAFSERFQA